MQVFYSLFFAAAGYSHSYGNYNGSGPWPRLCGPAVLRYRRQVHKWGPPLCSLMTLIAQSQTSQLIEKCTQLSSAETMSSSGFAKFFKNACFSVALATVWPRKQYIRGRISSDLDPVPGSGVDINMVE